MRSGASRPGTLGVAGRGGSVWGGVEGCGAASIDAGLGGGATGATGWPVSACGAAGVAGGSAVGAG